MSSPSSGLPLPGQVYAHVGQRFAPQPYDVLVLGAGRMGSLCAHFLLRAHANLRVLLLDQGGLPNEEAASILAPGIWTSLDITPEQQQRAEFTRALALGEISPEAGGLGISGPHDVPTLVRGLTEVRIDPMQGSRPINEPEDLPADLIERSRFATYRQDPRALTYSVASLTTRAAQSAIRQGADLMLNAHALPTATGVRIHRLSVTNTHQIVVHETHEVSAKRVIIAAGADGPILAEQCLGTVTHHARAYRQLPRLNVPSSDATPIIRAQVGNSVLTLRPYAGGYMVVAPIHHRDPHGYQPTGGRLSGVPVGVRRETLQDLLLGMEGLPALATEALEVGRSVSDVAGAWLALPQGGWPHFEALTAQHWLLLGGEKADLTGAGVAQELAQQVSAAL